METRDVSVRQGMGLPGWLTVLFVGLKLTGYISWSWWWVLSPVWISLGVVVAFLLVAGAIAAKVAIGMNK